MVEQSSALLRLPHYDLDAYELAKEIHSVPPKERWGFVYESGILLGSGAYSLVLRHPTDSAKVVRVPRWLRDLSYDYLEWCQTQDSPHLPKVFEVRSVCGMNYAVVERLAITVDSAGVMMSPHVTPFYKELRGEDADYPDTPISALLRVIARKFGFSMDLHGQNFMLRDACDHESIVITDPVV